MKILGLVLFSGLAVVGCSDDDYGHGDFAVARDGGADLAVKVADSAVPRDLSASVDGGGDLAVLDGGADLAVPRDAAAPDLATGN